MQIGREMFGAKRAKVPQLSSTIGTRPLQLQPEVQESKSTTDKKNLRLPFNNMKHARTRAVGPGDNQLTLEMNTPLHPPICNNSYSKKVEGNRSHKRNQNVSYMTDTNKSTYNKPQGSARAFSDQIPCQAKMEPQQGGSSKNKRDVLRVLLPFCKRK